MWFDLQITKTLVILIHLIEQIVGLKVFSLQIIRADFFVFYQMLIGLIVLEKNKLFPKDQFSIRTILRAAHPSSNNLLFYSINDTCIKDQCGHDIYLLEYIAEKLNMDIRQICS